MYSYVKLRFIILILVIYDLDEMKIRQDKNNYVIDRRAESTCIIWPAINS